MFKATSQIERRRYFYEYCIYVYTLSIQYVYVYIFIYTYTLHIYIHLLSMYIHYLYSMYMYIYLYIHTRYIFIYIYYSVKNRVLKFLRQSVKYQQEIPISKKSVKRLSTALPESQEQKSPNKTLSTRSHCPWQIQLSRHVKRRQVLSSWQDRASHGVRLTWISSDPIDM